MRRTTDDPSTPLDGDDAIAKVRELLPKFRCAMMVTHDEHAAVHVRPVGLQGNVATFGGVLWFFTDQRSRKVEESSGGVAVSLVCQNDAESAYLHLVGRITLERDLSTMRELFTPVEQVWFPDGLDDPNITLMKFEAEGGAYWDRPGGSLTLLAAFAKAVVTGVQATGSVHGDLRL